MLDRAFWGDEAWTVLISRLPWWDLVKTTAADFHPPLYYTIVHFWMQIAGSGEVTVRLVSLLFWLLSGFAVYFFARFLKLSGLYSLASGLLVLFNPFIFQYAFEARNYTLFVFLSIVSMWQFYKIIKSARPSPGPCLLYLVFSIAGLYTHYYMFFVVAAQGLYILIFNRNLLRKFFILYFLFFIFYLPWLPMFLSQTKSVAGGYWIPPVDWGTIKATISTLISGELRTSFSAFLPWIYGICLAAATVAAIKTKRVFTYETALFVFWFIVPFLIPIALSYLRPIFFYRYLVFVAVPLMLLPLFWLAKFKKRGWIFLGLLLGFYFVSNSVTFFGPTEEKFRPVLANVHARAKKGDVIYTVLPSFAEVVYYNQNKLPIRVLSIGLSQASGKALLDTYVQKGYLTISGFPKTGRYWYLEPGPKYQLYEIKN